MEPSSLQKHRKVSIRLFEVVLVLLVGELEQRAPERRDGLQVFGLCSASLHPGNRRKMQIGLRAPI